MTPEEETGTKYRGLSPHKITPIVGRTAPEIADAYWVMEDPWRDPGDFNRSPDWSSSSSHPLSVNRNALRYSIAFMLFVCLCVAGLLAGYRAGYPNGYASGQAKRQSEQPYPKVYDVGDLIRETSDNALQMGDQLDYQSLIDATQTSVFPDEWEALGGPCGMAPLPWLEALVVNATSGVHDRLEAFFGDLSSLKLAVAASRKEQEASQRARDEWIAGLLGPVSESLGKSLELTDADFDIIGPWNVQTTTRNGSISKFRYTFVDTDTVLISSADKASNPTETWYFVSPGSVGISGKAYLAATTADDALVLILTNDPQTFLVCTQDTGEPSDEPKSR